MVTNLTLTRHTLFLRTIYRYSMHSLVAYFQETGYHDLAGNSQNFQKCGNSRNVPRFCSTGTFGIFWGKYIRLEASQWDRSFKPIKVILQRKIWSVDKIHIFPGIRGTIFGKGRKFPGNMQLRRVVSKWIHVHLRQLAHVKISYLRTNKWPEENHFILNPCATYFCAIVVALVLLVGRYLLCILFLLFSSSFLYV